jgi:hypothetical protein
MTRVSHPNSGLTASAYKSCQYRIVFRFEQPYAYDVCCTDYRRLAGENCVIGAAGERKDGRADGQIGGRGVVDTQEISLSEGETLTITARVP